MRHQEMFGSGMDEMGLDDMEGEGIKDWVQNLYQNIKDPRGQQKFMPKPIREQYNQRMPDKFGDNWDAFAQVSSFLYCI
jgi:hypothetical protein